MNQSAKPKEGNALLSPVQKVILQATADGLSQQAIISTLGLTTFSIQKSLGAINRALGVANTRKAIAVALQKGLIRPPSAWAREATLPPHNPYTGPEGTSSMHANSASSGATLYPGPGIHASNAYNVMQTSAEFPYVVPTILMPAHGGLVCVGVGNSATNMKTPTVLLVSPTSLKKLSSIELTQPLSGNLAGGIYSYIDHNNNLVLVDGAGNLKWFSSSYDSSTDTGSLTLSKSVFIDQPMVVSLAPDYQGRIWFATQGPGSGYSEPACVGYYDPSSGKTVTMELPAGESVANSISTSPAGVAVVTTEALYLFRASRSSSNPIQEVWREEYANTGLRKPGQLSAGTGATPVFFGPRQGYEYIAITDNGGSGSIPAENFNIFKTHKVAQGKSQLVSTIPFLTTDNSGTENAPIAVGKTVFSPSTYGYWYPPSSEYPSASTPATAAFTGGAQSIQLSKGQGWTSSWQNQTIASAALPRLSIADQQIYTLSASYSGASDNSVQYSFSAIDPITGQATTLTTLGSNSWTGSQPKETLLNTYSNNPLQMTGVISPQGVFYQGIASGILAISGPSPQPAAPASASLGFPYLGTPSDRVGSHSAAWAPYSIATTQLL